MGEVLQGVMLWRKQHCEAQHTTESRCLLQLKLQLQLLQQTLPP